MSEELLAELRVIRRDLMILSLNVRAVGDTIGRLIGEPFGNREEPHG